MIAILGRKRIAILVVLLGAAAFFAFYTYQILLPKNERLERTLGSTKSSLLTRKSEAQNLRTEYEELLKQKDNYEVLQNIGFFDEQDRVQARERFGKMQKKSKVISLQYNISAVGVDSEAGKEALKKMDGQESDYVLLNSPVSLQLEAYEDLDVYSFVYLLRNEFPGHVTIKSLRVGRDKEVTPEILRQIGNKVPTVMVKASVEAEWRTLVHKDKFAEMEKNR